MAEILSMALFNFLGAQYADKQPNMQTSKKLTFRAEHADIMKQDA